jgi:hypothetical protein
MLLNVAHTPASDAAALAALPALPRAPRRAPPLRRRPARSIASVTRARPHASPWRTGSRHSGATYVNLAGSKARTSRDVPKLYQRLGDSSLIEIEQSSKPSPTNHRSSSIVLSNNRRCGRSDILHRGRSTTPTDIVGKALRVMRVVGQERESLPFHLATAAASDPPCLEFEIDPGIPVGQIACSPCRPVVPAVMRRPARATGRSFERRTSVMPRALRSPNTPRSIARGRNPGNRYPSDRRLGFDEVGIRTSCQLSASLNSTGAQHPRAFQADRPSEFTHTFPR